MDEPVATIGAEKVRNFYWKRIMCRYGIPKNIVSDNGKQFTSELVIELCEKYGIQNTFVSVEHPQANGQAESANKVILMGIKKHLDKEKKEWSGRHDPRGSEHTKLATGEHYPRGEHRSYGGQPSLAG
ncbi:hypothetical protein A2U01_0029534 [Trifolium medium]|uniref:Integrase catalytic domain-containing protein n=1 Tax=Trifolium medium TaxID=97028 RepID=A0A392P9P2_9FABA|nr:hypothetical protein [Trifolium medium]